MTRRVLSGIFGAVLFGILAPVLFLLLVGVPNGFAVLVWLVGGGVITGAALGALFPRVFTFVFELIMGV